MGRLHRKVTRAAYQKVAKPLLFKVPPDTVHHHLIKVGQATGKSQVLLKVLSYCLSYQDTSLAQDIHGMHFKNPVGIAAGFDKNIQLSAVIEHVGFGFHTAGSVTGRYCEGNPRPWFHRLPEHKALIVHAGLASMGSVSMSRTLRATVSKKGRRIPLSISIARTNNQQACTVGEGIKDYVLALKNLQKYPDMFEINISCPNTYGGEPYTTPSSLEKLLQAIDALCITQPKFVKMPSDLPWPAFNELLKIIVRHNVQGVTICNLRKDRTGLGIVTAMPGGISGLPVQKISDQLIYKTYRTYGNKLTIIGVGGIFTAEDAYRKIKNGASLVAMVTGLIYEGPQVVGEINQGLERLLKADGYSSISQAIGTAVK